MTDPQTAKPPPFHFDIPRNKLSWAYLFNEPRDCRCVMGWYLHAVGVPDDKLEGRATPSAMQLPEAAEWLQAMNPMGERTMVRRFMTLNSRMLGAVDSAMRVEAEGIVVETFAQANVKAVFVGVPPEGCP